MFEFQARRFRLPTVFPRISFGDLARGNTNNNKKTKNAEKERNAECGLLHECQIKTHRMKGFWDEDLMKDEYTVRHRWLLWIIFNIHFEGSLFSTIKIQLI